MTAAGLPQGAYASVHAFSCPCRPLRYRLRVQGCCACVLCGTSRPSGVRSCFSARASAHAQSHHTACSPWGSDTTQLLAHQPLRTQQPAAPPSPHTNTLCCPQVRAARRPPRTTRSTCSWPHSQAPQRAPASARPRALWARAPPAPAGTALWGRVRGVWGWVRGRARACIIMRCCTPPCLRAAAS